jgi:hypothetical protein
MIKQRGNLKRDHRSQVGGQTCPYTWSTCHLTGWTNQFSTFRYIYTYILRHIHKLTVFYTRIRVILSICRASVEASAETGARHIRKMNEKRWVKNEVIP